MKIISATQFNAIREQAKTANKSEKIKQTILNTLDRELAGDTKGKRNNILRANGKVYYNIRFGVHSFGAVEVDASNVKESLKAIRADILKGDLDKEIEKYSNSKEYKDLEKRFSK